MAYEGDQLHIKLPVWEPVAGVAMALMSAAALLLILAQIFLVKPSIHELAQQGAMFVIFVFALIVSANYMIAPAYIGKRIKAVIEKA